MIRMGVDKMQMQRYSMLEAVGAASTGSGAGARPLPFHRPPPPPLPPQLAVNGSGSSGYGAMVGASPADVSEPVDGLSSPSGFDDGDAALGGSRGGGVVPPVSMMGWGGGSVGDGEESTGGGSGRGGGAGAAQPRLQAADNLSNARALAPRKASASPSKRRGSLSYGEKVRLMPWEK